MIELVNKLMQLRESWTIQDFKDAYEDQWDKIPNSLEECREKMEEFITLTYDESYIIECIESEEV